MEFGNRIRELRHRIGFTLREASGRMGISIVRLSALETQRTAEVPTEDELKAFYEMYSVGSLPDYIPDFEGIRRQKELFEALEAGASDEEMLDRFGVFVHRKNKSCIEEAS